MIEYKIGQKIVIDITDGNSYRITPPYKIEIITKVTKTQVTTSDGRRYLKSNCHEVGKPRYGHHIAFDYFKTYAPLTEEEALKANQEWEEENKIAIMRNFIRVITWKEVSAIKIEQIYKILKGEME